MFQVEGITRAKPSRPVGSGEGGVFLISQNHDTQKLFSILP